MDGLKVLRVTSQYEHALACSYHRISKRGLFVNPTDLKDLDTYLCTEIQKNLDVMTQHWGVKCYMGKFGDKKGDVNITAPKQFLQLLKDKGFKVPKSRQTDEETAEALGLIRLFAETNDPAIQAKLNISKLNKVLTTSVRARLTDESLYLCQYSVHATETGRRGSKKHLFGFGNNSQNWPKYTEFGKGFRKCIQARPGKIFFAVDQKQAEDWIVVALSQNESAYHDMLQGVDRHKKTAAFLFGLPLDKVRKYPERFLGKKFRHANNYKMGKQTASDSLAKDGFAIGAGECAHLLNKMNEFDPSIRGVFHAYIESCLSDTRMLVNPLGRERFFLGLRPKDHNSSIFGKAYAYIPQSSVGDNTGMAVLYLDSLDAPIVHEGHDSIVLEIDDNKEAIMEARAMFIEAFNRTLTFHNGWHVQIPLEAEVGYNLAQTVSTEAAKEVLGIPRNEDDMHEDSVLKCYEMLKEKYPRVEASQNVTTDTGQNLA
jgi:hypothetical protein